MRGLKLGVIGIVTVMVLMVFSSSIAFASYDQKTGECWIKNESPSVKYFTGNFEIQKGSDASAYFWVQETREEHQAYHAFGYYTHYTKTKSYGWRGQTMKDVYLDYQINPAFNFGSGGHTYDEAPTLTYEYPYDNGAAMNYDGDSTDFESESTREAKVKITGSGGTTHTTSIVEITSGFDSIEIYIPTLLDHTIENPESGNVYEIPIEGYDDVVVTISESGEKALVTTEDLGEDVWITAR
jgi:hypothetical protein